MLENGACFLANPNPCMKWAQVIYFEPHNIVLMSHVSYLAHIENDVQPNIRRSKFIWLNIYKKNFHIIRGPLNNPITSKIDTL